MQLFDVMSTPGRSPRPSSRSSLASGRQRSPRVTSTSWESYTLALLEKNAVTQFGVFALKNYRMWTNTPGFSASQTELQHIVDAFKDDLNMRLTGLEVGGQQFTLTRLNIDRSMMVARSSVNGAGCVVYLCNTCVIIATHEEGPQTSLCYSSMEKLGDFLRDNGF